MTELIQMTRDDLQAYGRQIAKDVAELLLAKINELQIPTDIKGLKNIAKTLGCQPYQVTSLIKAKALGRALWKHNIDGRVKNGKVILDREKGVNRYRHYESLDSNIKEALSQMSETEIENYYIQKNL